VPGDQVVTDLVRLIPAMLDQRKVPIKQNPLLVWKIKGFKTQRSDRIAKDRGSQENLLSRDP
jgi:hypothetical protein